MMRGKKAFMYTFLLGVIGVIILFLHLYAAGGSVVEKESLVMGQSAIDGLYGLHDRELTLLFFDVGSMHASIDAVADAFRNAGWFEEPCGKYGTTKLWYDRGVACIPDRKSLSSQLSMFLSRSHFTRQLGKNPFLQGVTRERDFQYYADAQDGRVVLEGYAMKPLMQVIRCITPKVAAPVGVGYDASTRSFSWTFGWFDWGTPRTRYACGTIALRPDFHHEIAAPLDIMYGIGNKVKDAVAACEDRVDPASCLAMVGKKETWQTETVPQQDGAIAVFHIPTGTRLPGIDEELTVHLGVRVKGRAVA